MSTTLQRAPVRSSPRNGIDALRAFLAENRGVLRFMEKSRRQKSLVIESALRDPHDRGKEPPRFRIIGTGDAVSAYSLIVDYFNRYGYNDPRFFAEGKVSLSLSCGNFSRTTDDLRRDLKLFERDLGLIEFELPPMPDTIDDKIQDLLKQAAIPQNLWSKVRAELTYVLDVARGGNGKRSPLRPPSMRPVAELPESSLEKRRERERRNKAAYRERLKAKAVAGPQL